MTPTWALACYATQSHWNFVETGFKYTIFDSKDISRSREEDDRSILVGALAKYGWPFLPLVLLEDALREV